MKLLNLAPSSAGLLLFASAALSVLPSITAKHANNDKRKACQSFTGFERQNCPEGTIYVSGHDSKASFNRIQKAIDSLPKDTSPQTILVGAGSYQEQLNVTRKGPLYILGQTEESGANQVTVYFSSGVTQNNTGGQFQGSNFDNAVTAVLSVAPSYEASLTGSGYAGAPLITDPSQFGCSDFRMYNINLDQRWGHTRVGPALAVSVSYAQASFYGVGAFGFQDTVYVGHNASVLFLDSNILGGTDILYGFGTLWVEKSQIGSRGAGGGIVAWKGSLQPVDNLYGAYISNSHLVSSPDLEFNITRQVALGRPWNNAARAVYLHTEMEDHILPAGFVEWSSSDPRINSTLFFAEYRSQGPGFNATARAALPAGTPLTAAPNVQQIEHILTPDQAEMFSIHKVFKNKLDWVDSFYVSNFPPRDAGIHHHHRHGQPKQPDSGKMAKRTRHSKH
ncbi:BQ5605_C012g06845 [Microbotryum silenes-dioicae]|uniref:pectinesterase n=1 Tax=Microbotryum silenes-dioicae TaxID=796604 RepID=A0A2X0LS43_9BASI|nr:BQ5605_C012g06845 [Microbotryum silenes-dioicae]